MLGSAWWYLHMFVNAFALVSLIVGYALLRRPPRSPRRVAAGYMLLLAAALFFLDFLYFIVLPEVFKPLFAL